MEQSLVVAFGRIRKYGNTVISLLLDRIQRLELENSLLSAQIQWRMDLFGNKESENGSEELCQDVHPQIVSGIIETELAVSRGYCTELELALNDSIAKCDGFRLELSALQQKYSLLESKYQQLQIADESERLHSHQNQTGHPKLWRSNHEVTNSWTDQKQLTDQIQRMRQFISQAASTTEFGTYLWENILIQTVSILAPINIVDAYNSALARIEKLEQELLAVIDEKDAWKESTRSLEHEMQMLGSVASISDKKIKAQFLHSCVHCSADSPVIII